MLKNINIFEMKKLIQYLNPVDHLGQKKHSFIFPFIVTLASCILLEILFNTLIKDPNAIGAPAILLFIGLIIYFSFRDGILGGFTATIVTIFYYFYIMYSRQYTGSQLTAGIQTTIALAFLYSILAGIIGGLKQKIDRLIEQEANEKNRLASIIEQLPVGVLVSNDRGKLVQGNKRVEVILGAKFPPDFTFGRDKLLKSTMQGMPISPAETPLARTLATGKPITKKDFEVERRDGKKINVQISTAIVKNKQEKIIAAAQIVNDVTNQKEMEKRKDDFVNMASHELKTPITSLKLYIELLNVHTRGYNNEKVAKTLRGVKNQIEKLQNIVNDLLDVSRLQTGKLSYKKEVFFIDELISETIEELQQNTKEK